MKTQQQQRLSLMSADCHYKQIGFTLEMQHT